MCQDQNDPVPAGERLSNGGPLLPPKWAFGVLWGSYYDQVGSSYAQIYATGDDKGNLMTAAARIRADYSGDLMWVDSSWLSHNYSTDGAAYVCFKFDPAAFPDPGTMIGSLRNQHFHFGVWEWAWMGHGCQYFQTGVDNKYFVMNGSVPASTTGAWHGDPNPAAFDYTNPAGFNWWVGLNKPMSDWGLDFMKLDLSGSQVNSPVTSGGKLADSTKDLTREYHHAAYTVTKAYAAANDPRAMLNGARGFIMPKQTAPTNDQLPGWWTNDTPTTFAGMTTEMGRAAALNTTSSAAYWGGDTGGYAGKPTDELYMRWLEYSTFTPLQEFFGSKNESGSIGSRFPWMFGTQAQSVVKQYTQLRYRLLPFRYSNALTAYFVKPTVYPVRWLGATQLLVGQGSSQLLVQPVTTAGATTASVTLPAGTWIHYWTGKSFTGTASVSAPIDQVPLFVKAGSIIPMGPIVHWVDELPADPLTLDIYPSGTTSYTLYEDDGASEGYLGGAYSTTKFTSTSSGNSLVVAIGAQQTAKYHYAGQICQRGYILSIHGRATAPAQVTRDGNVVPPVPAASFGDATEGWYYDAAKTTVWVKFPLSSSLSTSVSM
jgi:alpha-glucosidase